MKKHLFILLVLTQLYSFAIEKESDFKKVHYHKGHSTPMLIVLKDNINISKLEAKSYLSEILELKQEEYLVLINEKTDDLGFTHIKYQQKNNGIVVSGAEFQAHIRNERVVKFTGHYFPNIPKKRAVITIDESLQNGLDYFSAVQYMWEDKQEEDLIKRIKEDVKATHYPLPELIYYNINDLSNPEFELAYMMEIYAKHPLKKEIVYVSAINGNIINTINQLHDIDKQAEGISRFYDTLNFICEQTAPSTFLMRDYTRGGGIETYNMRTYIDYDSAVDFSHTDTFWDIANAQYDEVSIDAHWGAEMTYDYYNNTHSRNSYDDLGTVMLSYIHYDQNLNNAFWDGTRMSYGDGGGNPYLSVDIVGHEMSHGVVGTTAGLIYQNESGALNESFADIFGNSIEHFALQNQSSWFMGEASNNTLRDMSNPNSQPFNDPDTYLGTYWYVGTFDNGGVHTNSGVQNFWYYLMVEGGTGTNDIGNYYEVNPMGWDTASKIAYRNLSVYLVNNSDYEDAAILAVSAADDFYGACSPQSKNVHSAWYAVGVLEELVDSTEANFEANYSYVCSLPANIEFSNLSYAGNTYSWDFDDGSSSSNEDPIHNYIVPGNYDVELISYLDNGCYLDTSKFISRLNIQELGNPLSATCTPTVSFNSSNVGIDKVSIHTLSYESGLMDNGYNDYTCKSNTIMHVDSTYAINILCSSTTLENVRVWVDLNRDQNFTNNELIFSQDRQYSDHKGTVKFSDFSNISLQRPLRMRVASDVYINTTFDACTGVQNGQIEDYSIILTDDWDANLLSVEDNIIEDILIYPNPINDVLNIKIPYGDILKSVVLIDVVGKRVLMSNKNNIDISHLSKGTYLIEVATRNNIYTKKLIKN